VHVFVDESHRDAYLMCAARVDPQSLDGLRRLMRSFALRGQRRLHFVKERPGRKREILDVLARENFTARIYLCRGPAKIARILCLEQLVIDLEEPRASRLVIEPVESLRAQDTEVIDRIARRHPGLEGLTHCHLSPGNEPLLWLPDAVAWAYGAGGEWRRRIEQVIDKVTHLGC
jgi:hypothetical protein